MMLVGFYLPVGCGGPLLLRRRPPTMMLVGFCLPVGLLVLLQKEAHPNYDASRFLPTRAVVENAKVKGGIKMTRVCKNLPVRLEGWWLLRDGACYPANDASRFYLPVRLWRMPR